MKVTFKDLVKYGLYDTLPEELKKLEFGDANYYIFYYEVDEENLRLLVFEDYLANELNVSLFRGIGEKAKKYNSPVISLAYFTKSFETRDGLFYQFLRTYNDTALVDKLYKDAIEVDRQIDISVSTNAINEIHNSDSFRRAISYFCPTKIQQVMTIYDMVNTAMQNRLSKNLYSLIKKVVTIVRFDGGILPELNGRIRFMVIGVNAELNEIQKEQYETAKALLRSNAYIQDIYTQTGWCFAEWDGKWRTNIADNEAKIIDTFLQEFNGRKIYVPEGMTIPDIMPILINTEEIYKKRYTGKLSDILHHPTLYEYYPELAYLPVLYFFGNNLSGLNEKFYYADNTRGGYIVICGSKICGDSLSILLHEIQHKIQHFENFASGGNEDLAKLVVALGGKEVRKIFSSINKITRYFKDYMNTDKDRIQLREKIYKVRAIGGAESYKKSLLYLTEDLDSYTNSLNNIAFLCVMFILEKGELSSNELLEYLGEKMGDFVYELLYNINDSFIETKLYVDKLITDENLKQEDVNIITFRSYQNLYGESESRATQSSRFVGSEFKNYFYLNRWENGVLNNVSVIDGVEEVYDSSKIKAAIEDKNGEYVLHFEKSISSEPILHELGHIVYDCLVELGYKDKIDEEFEKTYKPNAEEFFIDCFLGYIKDNFSDDKLYEDLSQNFSIKSNPEISIILDNFFKLSNTSERMKFLKSLIEII
jgi:hypothetical protein